jgi:arylsulfatase A-like enzyme
VGVVSEQERRRAGRLARLWVGVLLAAPAAGQTAADATVRPNVIFIVADDLGYGDLGVQGCPDIPTPNLDGLARAGVRCTSAYVTAPRCAPSRCGLLTGRYQQRFGCELGAPDGLPPEAPTLAQLLKPAGYATGLIGKWHLGRAPEHAPNARGFDEFFGFLGGVSISLPKPGKDSIPRILRDDEPAVVPGFLTRALGAEACAFLERRASEPFFLLLSFQAPHEPVDAPPEDVARFRAIPDETRRRYAASVAGLDAAVGSVLARLAELGLEQHTLVVFLSDNGGPQSRARWNGSSNAPLRGSKGSLLEAGTRVPLLVRWPGVIPPGLVYDEPVSTLDLVPTVLRSAGLPVPADLDGVDVLEHLRGREPDAPHEALFWRYPDAGVTKWAVRVGDHKLVHSPHRDEVTLELIGRDVVSLFDVRCDLEEAHDLARERPDVVAALQARWEAWNAGLPAPKVPSGESDEGEDD